MRARDSLGFSFGSIVAHRTRSILTSIGIAVGIAAVVLLTSLGEGVHRFVLSEFTQFGTNLIAINPGKTTTMGMSGAIVNTVRPLTIDDSIALGRLPDIVASVPVVSGNAEVEAGRRARRTSVHGVGSEMPLVWNFGVGLGAFLPDDDPRAPRALAVLGAKLRRELFGEASPLGRFVRIGGERYRVVGVMREKGEFLGFDLDDAVYVPAARALGLFDREGLMEVDVAFAPGVPSSAVAASLRRTLIARHGDEDFTLIEQEQMLDVLGSVLSVLTFAVAALGGISLLVGGVGILTIMVIAARERRSEIGLLRALGATRGLVLRLFLLESAALAGAGGLLGLAAGVAVAGLLGVLVPALPVHASPVHVVLAEGVAVAIGLVAGSLPALRAAGLDPIEALRAE